MKKIIIDLSTCNIFANASKFVELINAYREDGFELNIIKKNWKDINKGVVYDKKGSQNQKVIIFGIQPFIHQIF